MLGVLVGIVLAALVGTILYYNRRRKAKLDTNTPTTTGPSQPNNILPINGENVQEKTEKTKSPSKCQHVFFPFFLNVVLFIIHLLNFKILECKFLVDSSILHISNEE